MSGNITQGPSPNLSNRRRRRFLMILIKPSHYDDDGYVIQWARSIMPSNSLAVLYGIASDAAKRQVLGPDVDIEVVPIDETNMRVSRRNSSPGFRAMRVSVWSAWWAFNPTSSRAPWILRGRCVRRTFRSSSVDFTCPVA